MLEMRNIFSPLVRRMSGYPGGVPGLNMPFRRGMESPLRFTFFWLVLGTIGFGAPFLVIRHQMLRNVSDPPPEEKDT
ncbi:cytochrome c oxidase subunit 7C, mitochondrial [Drosophila sulfurigaster albostrigata]|uniref:Cytochrome c oxidase subunit 7C, mitochondrial n=1 Tax=Drosophila albomicans TaxID=7291 RepID=A0A6P8WUW2_DROAB|nr:cytochrome c oxidase subunit 7C, mitochondrial [Drosophila albomicans]XP_060656405.1 cytochrome c oxidase subunit 7C, mitochondrial [Drosophila nasuta]XP_062131780.1 cytochrome c oxidase subunit 7C, mitochondrial [Drosophila sulfurigaster albostrigata]